MWGKKKSATCLIVGDSSAISKIIDDSKSLQECEKTRVESCKKALQVATGGSTLFDFLVTDLTKLEMDDVDCTKQFVKLSPSTKVIYMIP